MTRWKRVATAAHWAQLVHVSRDNFGATARRDEPFNFDRHEKLGGKKERRWRVTVTTKKQEKHRRREERKREGRDRLSSAVQCAERQRIRAKSLVERERGVNEKFEEHDCSGECRHKKRGRERETKSGEKTTTKRNEKNYLFFFFSSFVSPWNAYYLSRNLRRSRARELVIGWNWDEDRRNLRTDIRRTENGLLVARASRLCFRFIREREIERGIKQGTTLRTFNKSKPKKLEKPEKKEESK